MTASFRPKPPAPGWQRRWPRAAALRLWRHPLVWMPLLAAPFLLSRLADELTPSMPGDALALLGLTAVSGLWLAIASWLVIHLDGERPALESYMGG